MSERLFCKLIDEVARYRHCNLCMVGLGEPGLHPKLDTICRAPKEIFAVEKARRPRGRYTLRQNIRVLDRWPPH